MNAENILRKIPQYTRSWRHLQSILRHGTLIKIFNLLRVEIERKLRKVKIFGRPYLLIVDPCNYCNLSCPLCPTGRNELNRPQSMLSLGEFKNIIDKYSKYLFEVYLHNWGESLINKDIYGMIEYAQRQNVGTNLSSNFVLPKPSDIENLIDSGLEYLIVSLDATSPDIYNRYRVGGDFNRVIENLNLLIKRRRERRRKKPLVEWQFIVMSINNHQLKEAEVMSKKIGVDIMRFIPVGLPFDATDKEKLAGQWFPNDMKSKDVFFSENRMQYGQRVQQGPCYYLYRSMVINPDGGISPCCVVYDQRYDFGQIWDRNIDEIWNNDFYLSARSLFSKKKIGSLNIIPCNKCNLFSKNINGTN